MKGRFALVYIPDGAEKPEASVAVSSETVRGCDTELELTVLMSAMMRALVGELSDKSFSKVGGKVLPN